MGVFRREPNFFFPISPNIFPLAMLVSPLFDDAAVTEVEPVIVDEGEGDLSFLLLDGAVDEAGVLRNDPISDNIWALALLAPDFADDRDALVADPTEPTDEALVFFRM